MSNDVSKSRLKKFIVQSFEMSSQLRFGLNERSRQILELIQTEKERASE